MNRTLIATVVVALLGGCAKQIPIKDALTLLAIEGDLAKIAEMG